MLVRKGKKRIGDILVEEGILTEEQLEEALRFEPAISQSLCLPSFSSAPRPAAK